MHIYSYYRVLWERKKIMNRDLILDGYWVNKKKWNYPLRFRKYK